MEAINQRKTHHIAEMIRRNISELRKSGADIGKEANEVFDMIDDLAVELLKGTPPRNCDVGTAEEQTQRFDAFCDAHHLPKGKGCYSCPAIPTRSPCAFSRNVCKLNWLQMPYEEGGAK